MQRALSRAACNARPGFAMVRGYASTPPRPPTTPASSANASTERTPATKSGRLAYLVTGDGRSVPPSQRRREFDAEMDDLWLDAATFERPQRTPPRRTSAQRDNNTQPSLPAWPGTHSWRGFDTARLPPRKKENIITLPAAPDTVIVPHARRVASVTWACPLFRATSVPATGVLRGGAPELLPPFPPRVRRGLLPDGTAPPADPYSTAAARSPDARAGTGFKYPVPGTIRAFILASKARVSRLTSERRRVRNRFIKAYEHVVNRSPTAPPLSHERIYTFILEAKLYEAPFEDICDAIERAIVELDRRANSPGAGNKKRTKKPKKPFKPRS